MIERKARAFWVTGPETGEIRDEIVNSPAPNEVLIHTLYSGVSRGTETLVFGNRIPASQYQTMVAPFQSGNFPAPVKYGYSSVGVVKQGPAALQGQTVFCLYPHQTAYVVPATAVIPLPPTLPPQRAVLAANMETALNGLWDATPRLGDRIAVIGAGTVGCLVTYLAARIPGCKVQLIDIDPDKAAVAAALGVDFVTPEQACDNLDLIIHASGSPDGLVTALDLAGFEATVLELSWFGDQLVTLPLGENFHSRRLTLRSSQVGHVATAQRGRWNHRRRLETTLGLLADPTLDCLISGESPFSRLPETLTALIHSKSLCQRIRYSDEPVS